MIASLLDSIPWTEILAAIGALIVLLLQYGNVKLRKIVLETKNNGGSTIKDQIHRIESSIKELDATTKHLAVWVEASQHLTSKPMFKADDSGRFTWINVALAKLLGLGFEDLKGYGWLSYVHGEDVERVSREWAESVKDKRKFETTFRVKNESSNTIRNVKAKAFPVYLPDKVIGFLGMWMTFEELPND